jgi:hypothetical protein
MKFLTTIEILIEKLQVRVQEEEEGIKPQLVVRGDGLLVKMEATLISLTNVMKGMITIEMVVVEVVVVEVNHQGM